MTTRFVDLDVISLTLDMIHELFEKQVISCPEATAIVFSHSKLTYSELDQYSNQFARFMQAVVANELPLVAICLRRSIELVIAVMGSLKLGTPFLVLDPDYPQERLAFMCGDADPGIVITDSAFSARLTGCEVPKICIDIVWSQILDQKDTSYTTSRDTEGLAYLIYTSGSTGNPKGVMINHTSLSYYRDALGQALGISRKDTYLHTASFSFSSWARQLLLPLSYGAKVVIAGNAEISEPLTLFGLVREEAITILDIVPSYWRSCIRVLARLSPDRRKALLDNNIRLVISASEPLDAELPRIWRLEFGHPAEVFNGYGHTETTGIVALNKVQVTSESRVNVPIGQPLPNNRFLLLDETRSSVSTGEVGELYISGVSLTKGYLNQTTLTEGTFVELGPERIRVYRSGDLMRLLPNGDLEFVGRRDLQIKVHGVRIEPEEIERVLREHPAVQDVTVAAHDVQDEKALIAYLVIEEAHNGLPKELRSFAKQRLPEVMVPSSFVFVDVIPRTPSGKLDRDALPTMSASDEHFVPANSLEATIASIWKRHLGLTCIDSQASFFELGGDSLKAIELVAELGDRYHTDVPLLALFFEDPTVAGMARAIQATIIDVSELNQFSG